MEPSLTSNSRLAKTWCDGALRRSREVGGARGEKSGNIGGSIVSVGFGAFVFDTNRRQLLRQGTEIHLTPKAFDLLALLIARAPAVVSKTEIHNHLWPGTFVSDATLVGLVKEVRRALRSNGAESLVRTAHRVGYAFAGTTGADRAPTVPLPTHWLMVGGRRIALRNGANVIGRDPEAERVVGCTRRLASARADHRGEWSSDARGSRKQERNAARRPSNPRPRSVAQRRPASDCNRAVGLSCVHQRDFYCHAPDFCVPESLNSPASSFSPDDQHRTAPPADKPRARMAAL